MELDAPSPAARPVVRRPQTAVLLFGDSRSHPNIFYRSGFDAGDPFVVVDEGGRRTLWVGSMEVGRARKEALPGVRVRSMSELKPRVEALRAQGVKGWTALLAAICQEHGLQRVAVERTFPVLEAQELRAQGITLDVSPDLYVAQRRIKTNREIKAIERTMAAAADAVQRAVDVIAAAEIRRGILYRNGRPLSGEDLVRIVETRLLELGCGAEASICCGGPDNADPHRATSEVLRAGLPIVLDIFPYDKKTHYWGDMTRTVVRGTPSAELRRMYDAVLEAQLAGIAATRPGVTGAEVHQAVAAVLARHGYGTVGTEPYDSIKSAATMVHSTGHGVGLEVHEDPRVAAKADEVLKPGDVITIEPGLYDPRLGGIRIEDTLVVTPDGCRNLTHMAKVFELDPPLAGAA